MVIASSALILLVSIMVSFYFISKNHYFCDSERGDQTRAKEKEAKSLPKYPNAQRYTVESSCGGIDGSPNAAIKFYTTDSETEVRAFYSNQNGKLYVSYDPRENRADGYKWWNVDIGF